MDIAKQRNLLLQEIKITPPITMDFEKFRGTDEMGWMEVTMGNLAGQNNLDLAYREEAEIVFDLSLEFLKQTQPSLNFELIQRFKDDII